MPLDGPEQLFQRALAFHQNSQHAQAQQLYLQVLSLSPQHSGAIHYLGMLAFQRGDAASALELMRRSLQLSPANAVFHLNYATVLRDLSRPAESLTASERAIALGADDATAHYTHGNALLALWRFPEAESAFRRAIERQPEFPPAWNNLGNALLQQEKLDEAITSYGRATTLDPAYADAFANLATALLSRRRVKESLAAFDRSLAIKDDADTRFSRSLSLLVHDDYERGWNEYEWRFRSPRLNLRMPVFDRPAWNGEDIAGKVLLLHCEQGLGDSIQFSRYAPIAATLGVRVILVAPAGLVSLFRSLRGVERVIAVGEPLPDYDIHCPLASLPRLMKTNADNIPTDAPYLFASDERTKKWRARMAPHCGRMNVGLVWAGSSSISYPDRSISLRALAPLSRCADVTFFSLQLGPAAAELKSPPEGLAIVDLTPDLGDWEDTAALMGQLDLIVSVDTGAAHLAGALKRPLWVMLHYAPDFRWPYESKRSPWYPTARLFHQDTPGNWASIITRVAEQLMSPDAIESTDH